MHTVLGIMMKIKLSLIILLFSISPAWPSYMVFEQKECEGVHSVENLIHTTVKEDILEIEVTMSFPGGLVLVNPELGFSKKGISLKVNSGTMTGFIEGCSCKNVFVFKLKDSETKNFNKAYIVIDGTVYDEVDLNSEKIE